MQFDRGKLKALVLYTCRKCESANLGAVKLHKVLYFSDMLHYAWSGAPITGATYRKRQLGPTCDNLLPILRELENEGSLQVRTSDYFGYQKKEYLASTEPEMERFSSREIALIDEVIDFVCCDNTARTISEFSHNKAWQMAEFGDILPYRSVYHIFPNQVSLEAMEWASSEAETVNNERTGDISVEGSDFDDFRSRVLETSS